jgi:hypothetical protein
MHAQLPKTLLPMPQVGAKAEAEGIKPDASAEAVDRIVLFRKQRMVKFYLRNNRYKRCLCDLSVEQMRAVALIIQKTGRAKAESVVFQDETYLVSPKTKRLLK